MLVRNTTPRGKQKALFSFSCLVKYQYWVWQCVCSPSNIFIVAFVQTAVQLFKALPRRHGQPMVGKNGIARAGLLLRARHVQRKSVIFAVVVSSDPDSGPFNLASQESVNKSITDSPRRLSVIKQEYGISSDSEKIEIAARILQPNHLSHLAKRYSETCY